MEQASKGAGCAARACADDVIALAVNESRSTLLEA